jgi:hypothetical protein
MRLPTRSIPLLVAIAAFAGAAQAAVIVTFKEPDGYVDGGRQWDREDFQKEIERHLQQLGERHLAPGQTVKIEVLDIDLAGDERFRPRFGADIRVLSGRADWPSVHLRYVVEGGGKSGDSREETIADQNYLMRPIARPERLAYEKRMLEAWFKARFAAREDRR